METDDKAGTHYSRRNREESRPGAREASAGDGKEKGNGMAVKEKSIYVCTECGYESAKWQGRCPDCGSWNTLVEETRIIGKEKKGLPAVAREPSPVMALDAVDADETVRYHTGMEELDRVLGGGIVPGAAVLVCGDPGIGKSTVLLQMCRTLEGDLRVLYVSGEESPRQIKLRANRLGVTGERVLLTAATDAEQIRETILENKPDIVVVDSIQTLSVSAVSSSPGSVSQVRESALLLIEACKGQEIPLFIVGHVNKDGNIAGPKVLEHMVDTVLYFEGDKNLSYRILRANKNRFGSTNEIGVFEMGQTGLREVPNPSEALLSGRPLDCSGSCITCLMEGTRPILVEIQALVTKTSFGNPRRVATGFDMNRTAMLLAVLEKRAGFYMGNLDVFVNAAGGMRADEPSADLAVGMAILSNLLDKVIPEDMLLLGEIGLAGEIRSTPQIQQRVGEGYRLGFRRFLLPRSSMKAMDPADYPEAEFIPVGQLGEAVRLLRN